MMQKRYIIGGTALILSVSLFAWYWRHTSQSEVEKLAVALNWKAGLTIAEIGAGKGEMTVGAAQRVGPSGHVFSTELDPKRLPDIKANVTKRKLANVTIIKAGEAETNLPPECCDAIFMRDVYHHLTHPTEIDASIFRALKPGGLLAVIDFPPSKMLGFIDPVKGVPPNRGGHGIPQNILVDELTAAGFQVDTILRDLPGPRYCIVFRKASANQ